MEYKALGEYCTITSSKRIFADQYVEEGIPFYRSKEIIEKNHGDRISAPLFIDEAVYNNIKNKFGVPESGDMLLTSVGTLGIPYIVKNERFYFKDGNLTWMKDFSKELSTHYLYYWITSDFGYKSLTARCIGSSQAALTIDILKKYKLLIPDRETQDGIVKILSKYDSLIEINNKRIKVLEQMAEELYKEWFVRFRFPGYENVEFENGLPKGWEIRRLGEFILINQFNIEKDYKYEMINYIDIGSVNRGTITYQDPVPFAEAPGRARRTASDGSIIWSMVRPNLLGYALVIEPNENDVFSTGFAVIDSNQLPFSFLYLLVTQSWFVEYLSIRAGGSAYPAVSAQDFEVAKFVCPPDSILKEFHFLVEPMFRQIHLIRKEIVMLNKQRDLLLPRLMSGKLEV